MEYLVAMASSIAEYISMECKVRTTVGGEGYLERTWHNLATHFPLAPRSDYIPSGREVERPLPPPPTKLY